MHDISTLKYMLAKYNKINKIIHKEVYNNIESSRHLWFIYYSYYMKINDDFYNFLYQDVKSSKMSPKSHYLDYGASEKRFYSIRNFKSSGQKLNHLFYLEILLIYLYIYFHKMQITFVAEFIKKFIIFIEYKKIRIFDIKIVIVHSWVQGGSLRAAKLYAEKIKRNDFILLTSTFQNMTKFQSNPMKFELWKNGHLYESHAILFSVEVFNCILKSKNRGISLFINHVMDFEQNFKYIYLNLFKEIYFILNDYYIFNSKWNLFDDSEVIHNRQLHIGDRKDFLNRLNYLDISDLYRSVNVFICPSFDVYQRVNKLIHDKDLRVIYHLEEADVENISLKSNVIHSKTNHVLILGDIGLYKGKREILSLIDHYRNSEKFKFHHFGAPLKEIDSNNYVCYGSYLAEELAELTMNLDINFAYLPFQCFETYSFALSDVFKLGLPLISTKIGAITERCVKRPNTVLLNCNPDLKEIVSAFESILNLNDTLENVDHSGFSLGELINARSRNVEIKLF